MTRASERVSGSSSGPACHALPHIAALQGFLPTAAVLSRGSADCPGAAADFEPDFALARPAAVLDAVEQIAVFQPVWAGFAGFSSLPSSWSPVKREPLGHAIARRLGEGDQRRSEEQTSELQ